MRVLALVGSALATALVTALALNLAAWALVRLIQWGDRRRGLPPDLGPLGDDADRSSD